MTYSNAELIRRFSRGKKSGKACNMEIKKLEINGKARGTVLVDYGWAILGHRSPKGRWITLFDGWYGYSNTTSSHLNKLRRVSNRTVDKKVKLEETYSRSEKIPSPHEWDAFPYDSLLEGKIQRALE